MDHDYFFDRHTYPDERPEFVECATCGVWARVVDGRVHECWLQIGDIHYESEPTCAEVLVDAIHVR